MTQYNPEDYWHNRGVDYQAPGEVLELPEVENLKKIVYQESALDKNMFFLEVGAGYGRILTKLSGIGAFQPNNYTMCDFVQSMRYNCLRNTKRLPDYWDGTTLPYPDKTFDFVISFSVLLHVPSDMIEHIFAEHIRVCKKSFFIATYNSGFEKLAQHCFEHDYKRLFEKHDLKIINERFFQDGLRANWLLEV